MARDRATLERIRAANRARLGLADYAEPPPDCTEPGPHTGPVVQVKGMAGSVPGMGALDVASMLPKVRVGSAFPAVDLTYDPSRPSTPPTGSSGGFVYDFLNRHVFRPFIEVGPVRYSPGDGFADYSGAAKVLLWGTLAVGTVAGAVVAARALYPTSWIARP